MQLKGRGRHVAVGRRTQLHAWWCPVENGTNNRVSGALLYCHGNAAISAIAPTPFPIGISFLHVQVSSSITLAMARARAGPVKKGAMPPPTPLKIAYSGQRNPTRPDPEFTAGRSEAAWPFDLASRRPHRALILAKLSHPFPRWAKLFILAAGPVGHAESI